MWMLPYSLNENASHVFQNHTLPYNLVQYSDGLKNKYSHTQKAFIVTFFHIFMGVHLCILNLFSKLILSNPFSLATTIPCSRNKETDESLAICL